MGVVRKTAPIFLSYFTRYISRMQRNELTKYTLPDTPGIYLFKKGRKILYIGKAASLRDRIRSYFSPDLGVTRAPAIAGMVAEAQSIDWQTTDSVLEALILEANLIKRQSPRYNVADKDNKSFNYLVITKEDYPRVFIIRGRELFGLQATGYKLQATFGPYPHGSSLKEAVKIVRNIFPFRDKCIACEDQLFKVSSKGSPWTIQVETIQGLPLDKCRPFFNRQIGLCPGVCTGEISKADYKMQIRHICELFSGNFKGLKRQLVREMKQAAADENFEKAATLRRQCEALEHIRDVSLIKGESRIAPGGGTRIEAYDVAHTAGKETVAVMTVVNNGEPVKDAYRKFKIRTAANNDVAALKETISRRLEHSEWPLPRIIAIDGGKAQVRAVEKILTDSGLALPVVGVVKDEFHRPSKLIGDSQIIKAHERDLLLANSEAHRFALNFHRKRARRVLIDRQ